MTQRILILSHDNKIGDAIVATGLFKPLRAHWPDCEIGVLCGPSNAALYKHHPDVKWLHVSASRNVFARMWASFKARLVGYDMVVHFGLDLANPSQQIVLKLVNAKQRFLFSNELIKTLPNDVVMQSNLSHLHYSARHLLFLKTIGAPSAAYQYDIRLDPHTPPGRMQLDGRNMVINSQSSTANRSLSIQWLQAFVMAVGARYPETHIHLLSASPSHELDLKTAVLGLGDRIHVCNYHESVGESLKVISAADVVVTPDTYAVHAASAWNIPVVALYLSEGPTKVWAPLSDRYVQIEAPAGKTVSDIGVPETMQALDQVMAPTIRQASST
jgi:ADP-heptose:LPS heptosyltransferase